MSTMGTIRKSSKFVPWLATALLISSASLAQAAGNLTPKGAVDQSLATKAHQVKVTLNNGFARTEVLHRFFNPNGVDLEAIYSFPLPKSASLSELAIRSGETEILGEVVEREQATTIYQEEKAKGNDTGLASKEGFQRFEFRVFPVRAGQETEIRFVYYQPIEIDTGVGRYVYPLEEGGTDDQAVQFWTQTEQVDGPFAIELELKSAWPVADVRMPGFESEAIVDKIADNHYRVELNRQDASLNRDVVFYYRLQENLPGRVELLAHRPDPNKPGTFMMVLTPGFDLKPLTGGSDYSFVLDVSGSMGGKLGTLIDGVGRAMGELKPEDRFRIVAFNDSARSVTRGWTSATPENVEATLQRLGNLSAGGSTNLYDGLDLGLADMDDDRATSVILVTDAVANTGVVDPKDFHALMQKVDVRVFGFLLGNSANDPLMRVIANASGGFTARISNADDILGQILLAKSKITHEALHDARLEVRGVRVFDKTDDVIGKIYRGQQLTVMGRYEKGGPASITLDAKLTGKDKTYTTDFNFPETESDHPELERLWALEQIETLEAERDAGLANASEVRTAVLDLGLAYQLVTDETSMVVLSDDGFAARGIERRNLGRSTIEHQAQSRRAAQAPAAHRVDQNRPMFTKPAPSIGRGGGGGGSGAFDPVTMLLVVGLGGGALASKRRRARK